MSLRLPFVSAWRERTARADADRVGSVPVRDWVRTAAVQPTKVAGFDQTLVLICLALMALGLVMVYSASVALPDSPRFARYAPTHFLYRHAMSMGIALVAALVVLQIPIKIYERWASVFFALALVLLIAVLLPFIGLQVNGARRWIPLGLMNFQPSELAKLATAMYAASYMVRKMDVKENFFRAVTPMAVALGVVGTLLLAEPDMGAFMVIATIAMGILFLGGVNGRMFALIVVVLLTSFALMILTSPWRAERIFAYLDPWNPAYAQGKAYQLTHSLIAFGRGEVFGQGLGASVEKLQIGRAHV